MAEAGGPPDGRADCCGAARGVCAVRGPPACGGAARGAAMCGAARGAAICGAARGAAMCGAARGATICGAALGADACGAGAARGAGAACGAGAAGAGRAAGAPPPCLCCGCAAAVVAIAAETIKTVAMRVFHWNMTPPPTSPTSQRQKWRAGFACEGAAAYMGLTWRATNSLTICSELRARKSGEIEMRLVRLGRTVPAFPKWGSVAWACLAAMGTPTTRNPSRPSMPRSRPTSPCWIPATFTARDKRLTLQEGACSAIKRRQRSSAKLERPSWPRGSPST